MTGWLTEQDERNAVLMAEVFATAFANAQAIVIIAHHVTQSLRPAFEAFDATLAEAMGTRRYYA